MTTTQARRGTASCGEEHSGANSISENTYRPPHHAPSCQEEATDSPAVRGEHSLRKKGQTFNRKLGHSDLARRTYPPP